MASLSRSCSSRELTGGNIKYAARAPLKALVSAAASLTLAVNASAPLRTKRCSRPASRPMTRTLLPSASRELAMIEPVFPLAPKITCMASAATATASLGLFIFVSPFFKVHRSAPFATRAPLHLGESTIHEQFDSRDVAAIVRRQKDHGFGSLIGCSEPSERNAFGDHLLAFLAHLRRSQ